MNILLVGAGVSGLTTAYALAQAGAKVTVWSKEHPHQSPPCSNNAFVIWCPKRDEADRRLEQWGDQSFARFAALSSDSATGIRMMPLHILQDICVEPWYAIKPHLNFRHARAGQVSDPYVDAHIMTVPIIDPTIYLPWLRSQIRKLGGVLVQQTLNSLSDYPPGFDVIINCTGYGAKDLAADDQIMPVRLQVATLRIPADIDPDLLTRVTVDFDGPNQVCHFVPHRDYIKIGTAWCEGSDSLEVSGAETAAFLKRVALMMPGFRPQLEDLISISPCVRGKLPTIGRVERVESAGHPLLIHHYGHNGASYNSSWGVAAQIMCYLGLGD